jgi:hypothetical protein
MTCASVVQFSHFEPSWPLHDGKLQQQDNVKNDMNEGTTPIDDAKDDTEGRRKGTSNTKDDMNNAKGRPTRRCKGQRDNMDDGSWRVDGGCQVRFLYIYIHTD